VVKPTVRVSPHRVVSSPPVEYRSTSANRCTQFLGRPRASAGSGGRSISRRESPQSCARAGGVAVRDPVHTDGAVPCRFPMRAEAAELRLYPRREVHDAGAGLGGSGILRAGPAPAGAAVQWDPNGIAGHHPPLASSFRIDKVVGVLDGIRLEKDMVAVRQLEHQCTLRTVVRSMTAAPPPGAACLYFQPCPPCYRPRYSSSRRSRRRLLLRLLRRRRRYCRCCWRGRCWRGQARHRRDTTDPEPRPGSCLPVRAPAPSRPQPPPSSAHPLIVVVVTAVVSSSTSTSATTRGPSPGAKPAYQILSHHPSSQQPLRRRLSHRCCCGRRHRSLPTRNASSTSMLRQVNASMMANAAAAAAARLWRRHSGDRSQQKG
jgi:hypothetical protein